MSKPQASQPRFTAHITHDGERFYLGVYGSQKAATAAQQEEYARIAEGTSDIAQCHGTISMAALAEELQIPRGTMKRWSAEGMPALRIGKLVRFKRAEAEAWIQKRYPNTIARARQAVVYVVQRDSDDAVKIGWTSDLMRRMLELKKNKSYQLVVLAAFVGDKPAELRLHARFAHDALGEEWFRYGDAVKVWLASLREIAA